MKKKRKSGYNIVCACITTIEKGYEKAWKVSIVILFGTIYRK